MRLVIAMLSALMLLSSCDDDLGPDCDKGKRCGNSCIAKDKVCRK